MQEESCTVVWGKFCSSPLSPPCFLCLSKPLPTLSIPPAVPTLSLFSFPSWPCLLFSAAVSFLISHLTPSHFSASAWIYLYGYLNYLFSFWSLLLLSSLPLPSFFLPSSIWLFISPIRAIFLRFPFRPWNGCLRGISLLGWDLCWMRLWRCIFRPDQSLGRCVLPQSGDCHPPKTCGAYKSPFIPPSPWMERYPCKKRSLSSRQSL